LLLILNLTPNFAKPSYENVRRVVYGLVLALSVGLAGVWVFLVSTKKERGLFLWKVLLAVGFLMCGIGFYGLKVPEKWAQSSRFVALFASSHTWWHIFAWLTANQLVFLQNSFHVYIEQIEQLPVSGKDN